MRVLSIGDEVRAGTYRLHSRFRRAINFTDGRRLVTLVAPDIGAGPVNLVVNHLPATGLLNPHTPPARHSPGTRTSPTLRIERYSVVFAQRRWSLDQAFIYRSLLHIGKGASRQVFRKNLAALERLLAEEAHPKSLAFLLDERRVENFRSGFEKALVKRVQMALAEAGRPAPTGPATAAIKLLAGCGFGLTPSGDDFIAGMLIALNVLGKPRRVIRAVCAAALGGNGLSNAFLRLARDGRMTEKQQNLVSTLLYHGGTEVRTAARKVLETGETSGADFAVGLVLTLKRIGFRNPKREIRNPKQRRISKSEDRKTERTRVPSWSF